MQEILRAAEQSPVAKNCFQTDGQAPAHFISNERPAAESDRLPEIRLKTTEPLVYAPHWMTGGAKHPGLIVEIAGLANVAPPPRTYHPHFAAPPDAATEESSGNLRARAGKPK